MGRSGPVGWPAPSSRLCIVTIGPCVVAPIVQQRRSYRRSLGFANASRDVSCALCWRRRRSLLGRGRAMCDCLCVCRRASARRARHYRKLFGVKRLVLLLVAMLRRNSVAPQQASDEVGDKERAFELLRASRFNSIWHRHCCERATTTTTKKTTTARLACNTKRANVAEPQEASGKRQRSYPLLPLLLRQVGAPSVTYMRMVACVPQANRTGHITAAASAAAAAAVAPTKCPCCSRRV